MNDEGAVAQLARAPALQAGGHGFESRQLHHDQAPGAVLAQPPEKCTIHRSSGRPGTATPYDCTPVDHALAAIALAVVASLQPTTLVRSVALLDRPPPGRTLAWRFALGLAATLFVVAVVAGGSTLRIIRGSTVPTTEIDSTDVLLGGIALLAALAGLLVLMVRRGPDEVAPELPQRSVAGPFAGFGLGMRTMVVSIAPLALYIAAVAEIVSMDQLWGLAAVLLVVVTIAALGPGLIAPALESVSPERAEQVLPRLHTWALTSGPLTAGLLGGLAGAALVLRGILN